MVDKMNRSSGLDLARVIALVSIMVCHYYGVHGGRFAEITHDVLGVFGNSMFFVLSGWCLGLQHEKAGFPKYGLEFIKRRIGRLYWPFALYIIIHIALLCFVTGESPGLAKVAMNLAMLPWFAKLNGGGYLWFVTLMAVAYFFAVLLSRFGNKKDFMFISVVVGAAGFSLAMWAMDMRQCYIAAFLTAFAFSFLYRGSRRCPLSGAVTLICLVLLPLMREHYNIIPWLAIVPALYIVGRCSTFTCSSIIIKWLSGISYEIYLVHGLFVFGTIIPLKKWLGDGWIFVVNYIVCSLVAAYVLKLVHESLCSARRKITLKWSST